MLQFNEHILDLGEIGVVVLTLDNSDLQPPLPGHTHGYADWHDVKNSTLHDRSELFARKLSGSQVNEYILAIKNDKFAVGLPDRTSWVEARLCNNYFQMPAKAVPLSCGRVLLFYRGHDEGSKLLRIISLRENRVLRDYSTEKLSEIYKIKPGVWSLRSMLNSSIAKYGTDYFTMLLGESTILMHVDANNEFSLLAKDWAQLAMSFIYSQNYLIHYDRTHPGFKFTHLNAPNLQSQLTDSDQFSYESAYVTKKSGHLVATAIDCDRVVVAQPGGLFEVIDIEESNSLTPRAIRKHLFRPSIKPKEDHPNQLKLSHDGRYLLVQEGFDNIVFDLGTLKIAQITGKYLEESKAEMLPYKQPTPDTPQSRTTTSITTYGLLHLKNRTLTAEPYQALEWKPLIEYDTRPKRSSSTLKKQFDSLSLPLVTLEQSNEVSTSRMYGLPRVTEELAAPEHEDQPLMLICELELSTIADSIKIKGLPKSGYLQVFALMDKDEDLQPELDNQYAPAVVVVRHVPATARVTDDPDIPHHDPIYLQVEPSFSSWPLIDDIKIPEVIKQNHLDKYEDYLNTVQPDGPYKGHQLFGYPYLIQSNHHPRSAAQVFSEKFPEDEFATEDLNEQAHRWRLLLQLNTDENVMWGTDMGMLYLMIRDDHLAAGDFSHVIALTDGH